MTNHMAILPVAITIKISVFICCVRNFIYIFLSDSFHFGINFVPYTVNQPIFYPPLLKLYISIYPFDKNRNRSKTVCFCAVPFLSVIYSYLLKTHFIWRIASSLITSRPLSRHLFYIFVEFSDRVVIGPHVLKPFLTSDLIPDTTVDSV